MLVVTVWRSCRSALACYGIYVLCMLMTTSWPTCRLRLDFLCVCVLPLFASVSIVFIVRALWSEPGEIGSSLFWWPTTLLQCFDTVGWVIRLCINVVSKMTYTVSSGILNILSTSWSCAYVLTFVIHIASLSAPKRGMIILHCEKGSLMGLRSSRAGFRWAVLAMMLCTVY